MSEVRDNWNPDDKLDRQDSANFLTNFLINRYELASKHEHADTFVLNIRADWGFGKTFFLHRWSKDLQQTNFPVVFFNAWENDFCDDPLIGFIAEINDSLSGYFKEIPLAKRHLDQALAVGRKLIKPVSLGIAGVIAKQLSSLSLDKLQELYSQDSEEQDDENSDEESKSSGQISSLISDCAKLALKEHLDIKATMALFKKRLERLIGTLEKEASIQLPLFVFIDELDRCRPTYAIELLEAVKHLFGVPGVYFVIATNLEQLGHSICAVYGEKFDAERYLKRFFDQEYMLPMPDNAKFTDFLFSKYSIKELGNLYTVIENGIYPEPPEQSLFTILCDSFRLGLRDRDQVAGALQAVLLNWPKNETVHLSYLLFLIVVKQVSSPLFKQLAEKQLMDRTKFMSALNLPDSALFKTYTIESDEGRRSKHVKEFRIYDLLWQYHHLLNTACDELWKRDLNAIKFPDKIGNAISQDCPREYASGTKPVPPITDYARRVSQSGQLRNIVA